jgi:hypothetical protein
VKAQSGAPLHVALVCSFKVGGSPMAAAAMFVEQLRRNRPTPRFRVTDPRRPDRGVGRP